MQLRIGRDTLRAQREEMAGTEQDNGLVTQHISKQLGSWCEAAHSAFLASHNLSYWPLTVIGLQVPAVSVTSESPSGDVLGPTEIALTLSLQEDLRSLLESHYQQQDATPQPPSPQPQPPPPPSPPPKES